METKENLNRIEQTAKDLADFGQLHLDKLKLRLLDNFSTLLNNIFSIFVLVILVTIVVVFLAVALTWALGNLIGSLFFATLIMAGIFLVLAVIVYYRRKKLIINSMVRMLGKIMFESNKDDDDDE